MVHFKQVCGCEKARMYEARIFRDGCYDNRDPWDGSFNVHIQGEEASISMLDKGWDREVDNTTAEFCRRNGAKVAKFERRGKQRKRIL